MAASQMRRNSFGAFNSPRQADAQSCLQTRPSSFVPRQILRRRPVPKPAQIVLPWVSALGLLLLVVPTAAQQQNETPLNPTSAVTRHQPGKRTTSDTHAAVTEQSADDRQSRMEIADSLKKSGVNVDWRKYDLASLLNIQTRVESARHLRQMGVGVDWKKYDTTALSDMEMRVETARDLARQGVNVDWHKYDFATLMDIQTLTEAARRLQQQGTALHWQTAGVQIAVNATKQPGDRLQMQSARSVATATKSLSH